MRVVTKAMHAAEIAPRHISGDKELRCDECGKVVERVIEFNYTGESMYGDARLCVDCLYEAYSTLVRSAYEKALQATDKKES